MVMEALANPYPLAPRSLGGVLQLTEKPTNIAQKREIRDGVDQIEGFLFEAVNRSEKGEIVGVEPGDGTPINHFADGLYARELRMKAGTLMTSKIHKTRHFAFILKGAAEVVTENQGVTLIKAPCMMTTEPGTKRVVRVLEDIVWITVHATEETDVDEIEKQIISKNYLNDLKEDAE